MCRGPSGDKRLPEPMMDQFTYTYMRQFVWTTLFLPKHVVSSGKDRNRELMRVMDIMHQPSHTV